MVFLIKMVFVLAIHIGGMKMIASYIKVLFVLAPQCSASADKTNLGHDNSCYHGQSFAAVSSNN